MPEIVSRTSKRSSDYYRREPARYGPPQADLQARHEKSSSHLAKNSWSRLPSLSSSRVHHGIAFEALSLLPAISLRETRTPLGLRAPGSGWTLSTCCAFGAHCPSESQKRLLYFGEGFRHLFWRLNIEYFRA